MLAVQCLLVLMACCYCFRLCARYFWIKPKARQQVMEWYDVFVVVRINTFSQDPLDYSYHKTRDNLSKDYQDMIDACNVLAHASGATICHFVPAGDLKLEHIQHLQKWLTFVKTGFLLCLQFYSTYNEKY